jgi:hypothetical protein
MAEQLPAGRLILLDATGHLYPTERPEIDEQIGRFFADCDAAR